MPARSGRHLQPLLPPVPPPPVLLVLGGGEACGGRGLDSWEVRPRGSSGTDMEAERMEGAGRSGGWGRGGNGSGVMLKMALTRDESAIELVLSRPPSPSS